MQVGLHPGIRGANTRILNPNLGNALWEALATHAVYFCSNALAAVVTSAHQARFSGNPLSACWEKIKVMTSWSDLDM